MSPIPPPASLEPARRSRGVGTTAGLYYYGYRFYDPVTGRWPSRDPIGEGGGVNQYAIFQNSLISEYDYLGLLIRDIVREEDGKNTIVSFKIPIAFIFDESCCFDERSLGINEMLKGLMDDAEKLWSGTFPKKGGGNWIVDAKFEIFNRHAYPDKNGTENLLPEAHATVVGYNLVVLDCDCNGKTSEVQGGEKSLIGANLMNIMRLCLDSADLSRTFSHEVGHLMGSDDMYAGTDGKGYVGPFKGSIMERGTDVEGTIFDHIFDGEYARDGVVWYDDAQKWEEIMNDENIKKIIDHNIKVGEIIDKKRGEGTKSRMNGGWGGEHSGYVIGLQ